MRCFSMRGAGTKHAHDARRRPMSGEPSRPQRNQLRLAPMPPHARDDGFGAFGRPAQLRGQIPADALLRRALHPAAERTIADRRFHARRRRFEGGVASRQRVAAEGGWIDVARGCGPFGRFGPGIVAGNERQGCVTFAGRGFRRGGLDRTRQWRSSRRHRRCRARRGRFSRWIHRCRDGFRRSFDPRHLERVIARSGNDIGRPVLSQQRQQHDMHQHGARHGGQSFASQPRGSRRRSATTGEHESGRKGSWIGGASLPRLIRHAIVIPIAA